MLKPNDSYLSIEDKAVIEKRAFDLLNRADAWNRFPVPLNDILDAANLRVAPTSVFDPMAIISYLKGKAAVVENKLKSAISKIFGIYDSAENIIHVDNTVVGSKQTFLTLHETGHHEIPTHKKMFRFFQDCEKTLSPEIADQFEREANNFARCVLFKGDTYAKMATNYDFGIKAPLALAKKFGSSLYASSREYVRTNNKACAVYILEPMEFVQGVGALASVRRIECSPKFVELFGIPQDQIITQKHALWNAIPVGRKMTSPRAFRVNDKNGQTQECLVEAFNTTYNILLLVYPVRELKTFVSMAS